MTKQEILDKYIPCQCWPAKDGGKVYYTECPQHSTDPESAMDEWAEVEATLFGDWIGDHPLQLQPGRKKGEWIGLDLAYYTTTELFQLYKTQQTK